jgi:hypothetical protein
MSITRSVDQREREGKGEGEEREILDAAPKHSAKEFLWI